MTTIVDEQTKREIMLFEEAEAYWATVQDLLELNEEVSLQMEQGNRRAILDVLAVGVDQTHPTTGKVIRRRALSAMEIKNAINKRLVEPLKKSNLYFHLTKLEELGLIMMVTQIPTGKKFTTYYGRTAKAIIPLPQDMEKYDFTQLQQLILRFNPDADLATVDKLLQQTLGKDCFQEDIKHIANWLQLYQKDTIELDIDYREMVDILFTLSSFGAARVEKMHQLMALLKLPF